MKLNSSQSAGPTALCDFRITDIFVHVPINSRECQLSKEVDILDMVLNHAMSPDRGSNPSLDESINRITSCVSDDALDHCSTLGTCLKCV